MTEKRNLSWVPVAIGAAAVASLGGILYVYRDRALGSTPYKKNVPILEGAQPLIGHANVLGPALQFHNDWRVAQMKKYGAVYQYSMPGQNLITTHNVQDVEEVLKNPYIWPKAPDTKSALHDFLGDGIFNADGDIWRSQRKVASNIFNVKNFRDLFTSVFIEESKKMVDQMFKAQQLGAIIELQDLLLRATLDSFVQIAMGKNPGAISVNGQSVNGKFVMETESFMEAFDSANNISCLRIFKPLWQIIDQFDGTASKQKHNMKVMEDFAKDVIAQKKVRLAAGHKGHDLLDLFMQAGNEDGSSLNETQMRDIVLNFIIAGRDTTAQTLSWTFWRLAKNPDVEKKCREELLAVLGKTGDYTYEKFALLKYNLATFMESLRLHANVPFNRKVAMQDTVLPGTNTPIQKGDMVDFIPYAMGVSTEIWGADAAEFRPERWFDSNGGIINPNSFAFPHFNAGPRICLGMNMAKQEAITFMAAIIRNFSLELVNDDDPKHWGDFEHKLGRSSLALTLNAREGIEFKLHPIA
ncbi:hypothetical protein SmJEL517_g05294 [Synchytrium microbalum]|uniref:Cytochrome P450 n=1 Tax=Synchytrium microbalum TaxID=1806994 RepID=A0A507BVZ7_9FUNG|nr:uncharacterized protein SmJEL517_g05294 [Synchytrium microbalum]TPX31368.1 hypothetical protein SmJEL517_g05294 [Synchytrium microbalum]